MSLPISRLLAAVAVVYALSGAAAAHAGDPCWECRAAACYSIFKDTTDRAWRAAEREAMASWDEISARAADLDAANAEHDALVAGLERQRDSTVEGAYLKMVACLDPET